MISKTSNSLNQTVQFRQASNTSDRPTRLSTTLKPNHLAEWLKSGVDRQVIELNVKSLSGYQSHDYLLSNLDRSDRLNSGRVSSKILYRYRNCEAGGWWVSGTDVLNGEDSQWGQFKPDSSYSYMNSGKKKTIKYEAPKNVPTEIFALKITWAIGLKIAKRHDLESEYIERFNSQESGYAVYIDSSVLPDTEDTDFWEWAKNVPDIGLIVTEGAKKAGCLLSAGYLAIALPGISTGYRAKDKDGIPLINPHLIPHLKVFAQKDREIVFCFDHDQSPKTALNVRTAIAKTARLFDKEGCKTSVVSWDYPEKGVDDVIVARGRDWFDQLFKARKSVADYNLTGLLSLAKYKVLRVNDRYLGESLVAPSDAQVIALKSPKGTGKTEWLARQVEDLIANGQKVLVVTHRIQLAKALCARFGIDHIEEIRSSQTKGILGYGLCVDSLHPNSQAQFDPDDWQGATLVIDECEQVIWHMLDSQTCQSNRVSIIETFQRLLRTAVGTGGKIYLSDADLSSISIDYVQKLIDFPVETWVVENTYQRSQKRKLISYSGNDPLLLIADLVAAIGNGEKVLVHTTGQKAKSKWGTTNLESYLAKVFPDIKILRIDRETVSDKNHAAYGCMENIDAAIAGYDVVLASPVIETGISIDIKGHFDSVWGIAQGIQTVDAVCQSIERLRDDVPRHIWVKKTAKNNRIGNGATSPKSLLYTEHKMTGGNIALLQQSCPEVTNDLEVNFSPDSLNAWANRAALINQGMRNYRESVVTKLLCEGYEVSQPDDPGSKEDVLEIKEAIAQTREANYEEYRQAVVKAEMPSAEELETLGKKKVKTREESLSERKGLLAKSYGVKVTPQLVEKDDKGWYPQIQLHYYLTIGNEHLAKKDERSLSRMKENGKGKVFKIDVNKKQLSAKVKALQSLQIEQFLNPDAEFSNDSLADWFAKILQFRFDIQAILGVGIHPEKDTAIAVAQRILKKMGLSLEFKEQIRIEGKPTRMYRGCNVDPDSRSEIFENWLNRDMSHLGVTPFSIEDIYISESVAS